MEERREAVEQLERDFAALPDKQQAWNDLLALTEDENNIVRYNAVFAFGSVFPYVTDKEQATKKLLKLTKDEHYYVRKNAAQVLGFVFPHVTDKELATKKLLELTKDKSINVRMCVASALGVAFPYFTDKKRATKKLLELTKDKSYKVRCDGASALGVAFSHVMDKGQATKELLELTKDDDEDVRYFATFALGVAFLNVTDKESATKDLLSLTKDKDNWVRRSAVVSIGFAFPHITDKKQAWEDLLALTKDEDSDVRSYANHSLGRISILKATEAGAERGFRKELEHALEYFESSANEALLYENPAKFCLPFYRSFHAITFKKEDSEVDVKKSIEEAKEAVEGSESKEKLLEAIENLSNALTEAQKSKGFDEIKGDLNAYSRYCNRVADLLGETEGGAPGATGLIRKSLPIINQQIKEIQERSTALYKQTIDTPLENFGKNVNQKAFNLSPVRDQIAFEKHINSMLIALSPVCEKMSEIDPESCRLHKLATQETFVEDKLPLINMILAKMPAHIEMGQIGQKLDELLLSIKPGISEELVISVGSKLFGTGAEHVIHIPLQEVSYPELKEDLEKIKGETKLASYPTKLASKIKDYLIRNKKDDLLNKLS